ncbi:MAG: SDR family oxidoreductase [Alphaproteobacteria bacterium]|nr:SDR family oxidoreductase [Alphaproteobacteria bacterium]
MTRRLDGKVAIVTGAAQGIGAAIAEVFVEHGARVIIADTNAVTGAATAARLGAHGETRFVHCDVSDAGSVCSLVDAALKDFDRIDILHQNAGVFPQHAIADIAVAEWDQVLGVNLRGCFLCAQACFPAMKAQAYGRIVFTSSITGPHVTSPGHAHYAASKGGINGFIRSAALEFAPFGITVNGIEPGNILTEGMQMHRSPEFIRAMEASVPLGRLGTPREVGYAALFLASDEAAYITGTTIIVDGGQILPEGKV